MLITHTYALYITIIKHVKGSFVGYKWSCKCSYAGQVCYGSGTVLCESVKTKTKQCPSCKRILACIHATHACTHTRTHHLV